MLFSQESERYRSALFNATVQAFSPPHSTTPSRSLQASRSSRSPPSVSPNGNSRGRQPMVCGIGFRSRNSTLATYVQRESGRRMVSASQPPRRVTDTQSPTCSPSGDYGSGEFGHVQQGGGQVSPLASPLDQLATRRLRLRRMLFTRRHRHHDKCFQMLFDVECAFHFPVCLFIHLFLLGFFGVVYLLYPRQFVLASW